MSIVLTISGKAWRPWAEWRGQVLAVGDEDGDGRQLLADYPTVPALQAILDRDRMGPWFL
jgi:hypothetical protein